MGLAFLCGVTRRGPGWSVAAHFSCPDMVARGNCSIRGATRRRHAVTRLLMLPNPPFARPVGPLLVGQWGAFRFLVREPIVVGVNVAVTATNGCNELVSHRRGGWWLHNSRLTTLIGLRCLSRFSQRRGRGRMMPFGLGFSRGEHRANRGRVAPCLSSSFPPLRRQMQLRVTRRCGSSTPSGASPETCASRSLTAAICAVPTACPPKAWTGCPPRTL